MRFAKISLAEAIYQTEKTLGLPIVNPEKVANSLGLLELPKRSTKRSAGYDFHAPFSINARKGDVVRIPLYVKVVDMPEDTVLLIFNRSSLALKYGLRLDNAVGVIDADYADGIMFQATASEDISIAEGERICQGVFLKYGVTDDDDAEGERDGGIGSTGR